MNVRVETRRRGTAAWDQPIVIVHPDLETARKYGIIIADALHGELGLPVRLTVGDNPVGSPAWGEAGEPGIDVVYSRGD